MVKPQRNANMPFAPFSVLFMEFVSWLIVSCAPLAQGCWELG